MPKFNVKTVKIESPSLCGSVNGESVFLDTKGNELFRIDDNELVCVMSYGYFFYIHIFRLQFGYRS